MLGILDGLASHPGGSNAPSRFMLWKPELIVGLDEPYGSFNPVDWTHDSTFFYLPSSIWLAFFQLLLLNESEDRSQTFQ